MIAVARYRKYRQNREAAASHECVGTFAGLAECETLWFIPMFRYRDTATTVSVQPQSASKKPGSPVLPVMVLSELKSIRRGEHCSPVFLVSTAPSIPGYRKIRISTMSVRLQNAFTLRGRCRRKPTDEVSTKKSADFWSALSFLHLYLVLVPTMRASNARPYELESVPTIPVASGTGKPVPYMAPHKISAARAGGETPRFMPMLRHRATAITV